MVTNEYLKWLSETASFWWNDSAEYDGMDQAIENGATGVTTNPLLIKRSLYAKPDFWRPYLQSAKNLTGEEKTEEILRQVTVQIAKKFVPIYERTGGAQGFVCAQVNPMKQGDSAAMIEMGRRLAAWAPNIAVKVPATAAGIRAIEELAACGITTVGTVSFTVAQAAAIAAAQQRGVERCRKEGRRAGKAFSVIMVGRLDDYLRDIKLDMQSEVPEADLMQAGTACVKRAYEIFCKKRYESKLMPAGMRGGYHAVGLAGADMSFSLSAGIVHALAKQTECREHFDEPVPEEIIRRLRTIPEFVRAHEPEALRVDEFIRFGATQRTLSRFIDAGWGPIGEFVI